MSCFGVACASSSPEPSVTPEPPPTSAPADAEPREAPPSAASMVPGPKGDREPGAIYRSEVEQALARGPGYLLAQLGPEPFRISGKFVGWEITRIFPDEPGLCRDACDLQVGDVILSVNGDPLETPQAFSNMVDALPRLDRLVVKSIRDEKRRVATYTLVDG